MIQSQSRTTPFLVLAAGYLLKFLGIHFLTPAVLISFSGLAFIYIVVIGNDVAFLKYLGMILPIDSQGTGTITGKDIMRV